MKCENCRFWLRKEEAVPGNGMIKGICVRYPPTATGSFVPIVNRIANTMTPKLIETTVWPTTNNAQWCGEARVLTEQEENDGNRKTPKETQEIK